MSRSCEPVSRHGTRGTWTPSARRSTRGVTWRPPEGWPEPGPFVGREAVMRWFEQLREVYDDYVTELIGDLDRSRRPGCREPGLARRGPRPRGRHRVHGRLHRTQREGHRRGAILGSGRGPRSRRAVGVGDVAGERGGRAPSSTRSTRGDPTPRWRLIDPTSIWRSTSRGRRARRRSRGREAVTRRGRATLSER